MRACTLCNSTQNRPTPRERTVVSTAEDDPEARFRRWPLVLRRWGRRALLRRLRQPFRRARWDRANRAAVRPYLRPAAPRAAPAQGLACALGDFSGRTGLSRAGLYELERLRGAHPDLLVRDLGEAIHGGGGVEPEAGPPLDRLYLLSAPDTYPMLFGSLAPQRVRGAHRTGLWVWETPNFPSHWRFAIGLVDEIWTPSEYSRRAIAPAVGGIPVTVRPHAVQSAPLPGLPGIDMRARLGVPETAFFGLAVMDIVSCPARKNPWAHVAAWRGAFGDDPSRVLVLKLRASKLTRVVLRELREMTGGAANIRLLEDELSADEIAALQSAADVYLSLHRAEGYGLNIHECLALGTPVLATDFSANAEYGPAFPGYRGLPFRLVPYRDWTGHYADRGFEWAEVDLGATEAALRGLAAAKPD